MVKKTLTPRKFININGKLYYNESMQAWNKLKLKKEILDEFPELKEKRSIFSYDMIYHRNKEELEKELKRLAKEKIEVMPILLWLYKEM